ncbi:MAG TPA: hypothetical protein VH229_08535 [Candidatus Udaeobacter sp.]|jgi:hypothetical protein|nr:hypothetical protein [Candidatus Udaeobacter sp.]
MMVRALSKSVRAPSMCGKSPTLVGGDPFSWQSVQAAGMSERLPSGRVTSNNKTPRLRMLPMTAKLWPSKAWHLRVMITASGILR